MKIEGEAVRSRPRCFWQMWGTFAVTVESMGLFSY